MKLILGLSGTTASDAGRENRSRIRKLSTQDGIRAIRAVHALIGEHGAIRAHVVAHKSPRLDGRDGLEHGGPCGK